MASKSTTPVINVPGRVPTQAPAGAQVSIFQRGSTLYEDIALGTEVDLKFDDGTVIRATVSNSYANALIDLIAMYGPQSVYTYSQPYSARGLIIALGGGEVVDVTKLYTALVVTYPYQAPASPLPAA